MRETYVANIRKYTRAQINNIISPNYIRFKRALRKDQSILNIEKISNRPYG